MYYLYLKTHNITNLKYMGYTTQENYNKYQGSGVYWKRHIKKYGYDVKTDILLKTESYEELIETAAFFNNLFKVKSNKDFANLVEEIGCGGDTSEFRNKKQRTNSQFWKDINNKDKLLARNIKIKETCLKTKQDNTWKDTVGKSVSEKAIERQNSEEWKNNQGLIVKEKASKRWEDTEYKKNISIKNSLIQNSEEWKKKHHKECPYCNSSFSPGNYSRHVKACARKNSHQ